MSRLRHHGEVGAAGRVLVAACFGMALAGTGLARTEGRGRKNTLSVVLDLPAAKPRSGAPITANVKFDWQGTKLLEGKLAVTFRDGRELLTTCLSAPLALTPGEQCFGMIFPAINADTYSREIQAHVRFLTKDGALQLGSHSIFMPVDSERSLVICVSEPRRMPDARRLAIMNSLRLEHYDPERRLNEGANRSLSSFPVHLQPGDLPAGPLGYCSYDLVFLAGDGFGLLKKRQLDAISRWVEAGGSVFVMPEGGLKEYHVDFLNRLVGATGPDREFILDSAGTARRLPPESESGTTGHYPGLGRAVVVTRPVDVERDIESPGWRLAAGHLWKARASQLVFFVGGAWRTDQEKRDRQPSRHREYYGQESKSLLNMQVEPVQVGSQLFGALVPRAIRIVPLWLIVLILVLFVLAIGPADYFVLGMLKRRKLTWLTFPAVCVCFSLFTMFLSEWYMGRKDYRNSITFVDVGEGGRVLRRNTFEMIFTARHMEVSTETTSGFFSALDHRRFGGETSDYVQYRRRGGDADGDIPPPAYAGRIPGAFTARQQVRQWTPQLNRIFRLGAAEDEAAAAFDWNAADPFLPENRGNNSALLANLVEDGRLGGGSCLYVVNGYDVSALTNPGSRPLDTVVIQHTSVRPQAGLFSVISQISPNGGADFEDLSILDPTDENQRLLVVVTKQGDSFVVYRRLYRRRAGEADKE